MTDNHSLPPAESGEPLTVTIFGRPVQVTHEQLLQARTTLLLLACSPGLSTREQDALGQVDDLLTRVIMPGRSAVIVGQNATENGRDVPCPAGLT